MTTSPTSSKSFSVRFYWRVTIVALWLVAGIAIAVTVKDRLQEQKNKAIIALDKKKEQPIEINNNDKQFTKNPDGTITVHPQPAGTVFSTWDPEGIEDFTLVDSNGKTVTKQDMLGKPWAVCFIFTDCRGACPMISQMMKNELQDRLKKVDVRLVSLTVDPEIDTPKVLAGYAKQYNAQKDKWIFLTGEKKNVFRLIRQSFKKSTADKRTHSSDILHIDATGVVQGKYDGTDTVDLARLRNALKKEAKEILDQKELSSRPPVVAPLP